VYRPKAKMLSPSVQHSTNATAAGAPTLAFGKWPGLAAPGQATSAIVDIACNKFALTVHFLYCFYWDSSNGLKREKMEYWEMTDTIDSKESFIKFIVALRSDWELKHELVRRENGADTKIKSTPWENCYLPDFLEAMGAWIEDTSNLSSKFSYKDLANILTAATMYE
jgi:hypothetical protein